MKRRNRPDNTSFSVKQRYGPEIFTRPSAARIGVTTSTMRQIERAIITERLETAALHGPVKIIMQKGVMV
jgi:hypothetical protein